MTFFTVVTKVCSLFNGIRNSLCSAFLYTNECVTVLIFDCVHIRVVRSFCHDFFSDFFSFLCLSYKQKSWHLFFYAILYTYFSIHRHYLKPLSLFLRLNETDFLMSLSSVHPLCSFSIYTAYSYKTHYYLSLLSIHFSVQLQLLSLNSYKSHKSQLN